MNDRENLCLLHSKDLLDQKRLFLLFKRLAGQHSVSIAKNIHETIKEFNSATFTEDQKLFEDLYKIAATIENKVIDVDVLKQGVNKLLDNRKTIPQPKPEDLCVNDSVFQNKILSKENNQKTAPVPAVYDMLSLLYLTTNEKQRQQHFHDLTKYYYRQLKDHLKQLSIELDEILPLPVYEKKIKDFIPNAKLEVILHYLNQDAKEDTFTSELIQELYLYVLYPKINIEDCFKIAKEVVGIDYNFLSYELVEANGLLGALGQYYKLKLTINKAGDDVVLNLFAKFMIDFPKDAFPGGEDAFPKVGDAFPKDEPPTLSLQEEFVYTIFVPELKNIGLGNICDFLPRCYFMRSSDVMVFEDLTYSDYEAVNSEEPYSYEMLLLVVKKLAKMHACSLLYEEITSKGSGETTKINVQFSKYVMGFSQAVDTKFKDTIHYCNVNTTVNYVYNQFPDVAKEITMEEFRERSRDIFDSMLDKMKTSGKYRNVICHGDIWGGNILFKFEGTRPVDCSLVDYQMIRYCPPAQDLMAFLYINTDKNTRTNYLSKLINDYYTEMSTIFKRYSFDLSTVYPYEVFMDSCEYMKSYAVCQAAAYYPSSLDRKKVQDLLGSIEKTVRFFAVDKTEVLKVLMKHDWIRSRFREIVEDLYDLCLQK